MSNTEVHKIYFWTHEGPVDEGSRGVPGNQVMYQGLIAGVILDALYNFRWMFRKKYDGKFNPNPPRAMFKGSYGAYREENSALDQKYALQDTGLDCDPWEKYNLE